MTTENEAREAIVLRFETLWTGPTPYGLDNETFDEPPTDGYVHLMVLLNQSNQDTLGGVGSRKYLRGGTIRLEAYRARNKGMQELDAWSLIYRTIFEGVRFSGVWTFDVVPLVVGETEDGAFFQVNYDAAFQFQETR